MNIEKPVADIMTEYVKTLLPTDNLWDVKRIFDRFNIHHIPIVDSGIIKGIVSKTDFNHFVSGGLVKKEDKPTEEKRLSEIKIAEVMKTKVITIRKEDPIRLAMEIFRANRFHALPVVEDDILIGIVTPFDVLNEMLNEPVSGLSNTPKNLGGNLK